MMAAYQVFPDRGAPSVACVLQATSSTSSNGHREERGFAQRLRWWVRSLEHRP